MYTDTARTDAHTYKHTTRTQMCTYTHTYTHARLRMHVSTHAQTHTHKPTITEYLNSIKIQIPHYTLARVLQLGLAKDFSPDDLKKAYRKVQLLFVHLLSKVLAAAWQQCQ